MSAPSSLHPVSHPLEGIGAPTLETLEREAEEAHENYLRVIRIQLPGEGYDPFKDYPAEVEEAISAAARADTVAAMALREYREATRETPVQNPGANEGGARL